MTAAEKLQEKQAGAEEEYEALRGANQSLQDSLKQALDKMRGLGAEKEALQDFETM